MGGAFQTTDYCPFQKASYNGFCNTLFNYFIVKFLIRHFQTQFVQIQQIVKVAYIILWLRHLDQDHVVWNMDSHGELQKEISLSSIVLPDQDVTM